MGVIPHANASITDITRPAGSRDFDTAGTAASVWAGTHRAYYLEAEELVRTGQVEDRITRRRLYIPFSMRNLPHEGDTVTFTIDGDTDATEAVIESIHRYPSAAVMAPVILFLRAA